MVKHLTLGLLATSLFSVSVQANSNVNNNLLSVDPPMVLGETEMAPQSGQSTSASSMSSQAVVPGKGGLTFENVATVVKPSSSKLYQQNNVFKLALPDGSPATHINDVTDSYAFLDGTIHKTSSDVLLKLDRNKTLFASFAQNNNQRAVANALDRSEQRGENVGAVRLMYGLTHEEVPAALSALSGEAIADARGMATSAVNAFTSTVRDQMMRQSVKPALAQQGFQVWATLFGGGYNISSTNEYAATQTQIWGGIGGIQKEIDPSFRIGLAAGGSQSRLSVSALQSSAKANLGHVALYLQKDVGDAYFQAIGGWSSGQTTFSRSTLSYAQYGSFAGQGPSGRLEAGYLMRWNKIDFVPYVALQGVWIRQNGMSEDVGSFGALYVSGQTVTSLPGSIGVQLRTMSRINEDWSMIMNGRAAYVHEFYPSRTIEAQFFGMQEGFSAKGQPMPSNGADIGLGFEVAHKNGLSMNLGGDVLIASGATGWRWQGALAYKW